MEREPDPISEQALEMVEAEREFLERGDEDPPSEDGGGSADREPRFPRPPAPFAGVMAVETPHENHED